MIISMQKIKDINWFFLVLLLIKESFNLTRWETQEATPNQKVVSGATFPWCLSPSKKTKITCPQIESCNLIVWEAQLATSKQKR